MSNEKDRAKNIRASFWAHVYTHTMVQNNALLADPQAGSMFNVGKADPMNEADAALVLYDARFNKPEPKVEANPELKQFQAKPPSLRCLEPRCALPFGHAGAHLLK